MADESALALLRAAGATRAAAPAAHGSVGVGVCGGGGAESLLASAMAIVSAAQPPPAAPDAEGNDDTRLAGAPPETPRNDALAAYQRRHGVGPFADPAKAASPLVLTDVLDTKLHYMVLAGRVGVAPGGKGYSHGVFSPAANFASTYEWQEVADAVTLPAGLDEEAATRAQKRRARIPPVLGAVSKVIHNTIP